MSFSAPGSSDPRWPRVHLLIPTHTTRHLAACLASLAWQRRAPDSVVVTCDTDDAAIGELLDDVWPRIWGVLAARGLSIPQLLHTYRPHQGEPRLNQVRNNGLRALEFHAALADSDLVIVLDGDTLLDQLAVLRHAGDAARGAELIIPFRINMDEASTARITGESVLEAAAVDATEGPANTPAILKPVATPAAFAALDARDRRYRRQLLLRRTLPFLVKSHKPKVLGGHHAVTARALRAVNGYDEEYIGYGYDDDDLTRRLYRLRPSLRVSIAVQEIGAFHLWHPTRAPSRPTDAPGYTRFARTDLPMTAAHGWKNPIPQPEPTVRVINAGVPAS